MIISEIGEDSPFYQEALDLRYELFFKGLGLPKSVTADDLEPESIHIALTEDDQLLAYGRLSPLDASTYRISQIVVNPNHRRKGYASLVVLELMNQAKHHKAKEIVLNSRVSATALYQKLGFREIGDVYRVKLTGVEHQKMRYGIEA